MVTESGEGSIRPAHPYEVEFQMKTGEKTSKFYQSRSDRNREADRLENSGKVKWVRIKDHN